MSPRNAKPTPLDEEFEPSGFGSLNMLRRVLPLVILIALFASLALWVQPMLQERVAQSFDAPSSVRFDWPLTSADTTWMPVHEQQRLTDIVSGTVTPDPFDQESLSQTHAILMSSGWFDPDLRINRVPGSVVEVQGTWRTPTAVVRIGDTDHLVGAGGELLPLEYAAGQSWPVRVIEGVGLDPPRRAGSVLDYGAPWTGGSVQASIALLALLRTQQTWEQIAGIDARQYQRNEHLGIITRQGGTIVWGSAPGTQAPGEVPDTDKLRRLARLLEDPAWVSAGMPRVEIFNARVVIHEQDSE
jgi:hypothetical protein